VDIAARTFRALFEPAPGEQCQTYCLIGRRGGSTYGIPCQHPRAGAVGLRFFNTASRSTQLRLASVGVSAGLTRVFSDRALGVGRPRDIPSIFGSDPSAPAPIVPRFGTARANQKPVLASIEDDSVVRITKMGVDPLTSRLVRSEYQTLRSLVSRSQQDLILPLAIELCDFHGHPALVETALPLDSGIPMPDVQRRAAAAMIAELRPAPDYALSESPWAGRLWEILAALPSSAQREAMLQQFERLLVKMGHVVLPHGSWHGDFTRWNTTVVGDQVAVWDWERFEDSTPVGFDLLHWDFQDRFDNDRLGPQSARGLISSAAAILRHIALDPASAQAVAGAYLLTIAARYCAEWADRDSGLTRVDEWLLPALGGHDW
jgi:hypothetical protein